MQSLQYLPDDEQARHNLEMTLRLLEQQQQERKDPEGGDDQNKGERQEQDEQSGDRQQDSENQERDQDSPGEQQENEPADNEEQQTPQQPDSTGMSPPPPDSTSVPQPQLTEEDLRKLSREDAMRILQALEEQEKRLQAERRKAAFRRLKRSGKDW